MANRIGSLIKTHLPRIGRSSGIALFFGFILSSCSSLEFPGVYVLPVDQGNIVTQEMVDQLRPGMSKSQVEYILGSPVLRDTFKRNRWDYIYTLRQPRQPLKRQRLTVEFSSADRLENMISTLLPNPPHEEMQEFEDKFLIDEVKKKSKRKRI
jgi:outer membrane protein assembly factor BamE